MAQCTLVDGVGTTINTSVTGQVSADIAANMPTVSSVTAVTGYPNLPLLNIIKSPIDPEWYSPGGTSTSDDTAIMNRVIQDANNEHRAIRLRRMYTTDCLGLYPDMHIYGEGPRGARNAANDGAGLRLKDSASNLGGVLYLLDGGNVNAWADHGVTLQNFTIAGSRATQTYSIAGISLDHTGGSPMIPRHLIQDMYIYQTHGAGIYISTFSSDTKILDSSIYFTDSYGLWDQGVDSVRCNMDIGETKLHGVFADNAVQVLYNNMKAWGAGQYNTGNNSSNFYFSKVRACLGINLNSQEAVGDGFAIVGSGTNQATIQLVSCISDGDGILANKSGLNVFNATNIKADITVGKANAGLAGTPTHGIAIGTCNNSEFTLRTPPVFGSSPVVYPITGNIVQINSNSGENYWNINGNLGAYNVITYAASVTPDATAAVTNEITLTGNITIANPTLKPAGFALTFVLKQNGVGGWSTTFGSSFKTNWTPSTAASATNIISFISDGTNWWQTGSATGL